MQERNRKAAAEAKYAFMDKTIHYAVYGLAYLAWIGFGIWFFLNSPMGVFGPTLSKVKATPNGCGGVCPGAAVPIMVTVMAASAAVAVGMAMIMPILLFTGISRCSGWLS